MAMVTQVAYGRVWISAQVCLEPQLCPWPHIIKFSSFMKSSWAQVVPKGILGNRKSFGFKRKSHLYKASNVSHAHNNKKLETTQRPNSGKWPSRG